MRLTEKSEHDVEPPLNWDVETREGISGLESIEGDWRSVFSAMADARSHHGYDAAHAYAVHLAESADRLRYVVLSDGDGVRAIVPVEQRRDRSLVLPMRVLGLPWPYEWPLGDVIAADSQAARDAVPVTMDALKRLRVPGPLLIAGPLPSDSAVWEGITRSGALAAIHPQGAWDYITTTGTYDDYLKGLGKNFRGNLRKARNKLDALDDVRFVTASDPDEIESEFSAFLAVESSGWKGATAQGEALACKPAAVAWYRAWFAALASQRACEINSLYVGETCIASQLCVRTRDVYEIHKIGFDESFARLAPGQLLMEHTLQRCFRDAGIRVADLMSDTPWHRDWGVASRPMSVGLVARSVVGRALVPVARFRFGPARRAVRAAAARASSGRR